MNYLARIFEHMHRQKYTSGLLLLILSVAGNFIAETLGCGTQRLLMRSMIAKQILILFLIYFTINFTTSDDIEPVQQIKNSLYVWVFFLMFTKMNVYFTIAAFLMLAVLYGIGNFQSYYRQNNQPDKDEEFEKLSLLLEKIMLVTVVAGFLYYLVRQTREHKKFSILKFVLGSTRCDHSK